MREKEDTENNCCHEVMMKMIGEEERGKEVENDNKDGRQQELLW